MLFYSDILSALILLFTLRLAIGWLFAAEALLEVFWHAGADAPVEDLSVYVKAFAAVGTLLAQGDQFAPVYSLRPMSSWLAGERP